MKLLFPLVTVACAPAYWLLDAYGLVPVSLRDRPWPFALLAVLSSLLAMRRLRTASLILALLSLAALGCLAHVRYRLPPSAGAGVGQPLPDVTLPDQSGQATSLREMNGRPLLLIWFRGSWCPYCRRQLGELAAEATRFSGVRILAVAPDPPEPLRKLKDELQIPFSLLSDPERKLVNRCESAHCVAIAGPDGRVRWEVVSGNWEENLPARALLQAAYRSR